MIPTMWNMVVLKVSLNIITKFAERRSKPFLRFGSHLGNNIRLTQEHKPKPTLLVDVAYLQEISLWNKF